MEKKGVVSKTEVSVAFVGVRKMAQLNRDFRGKNEATSVLSFSQVEKRAGERFVGPPNNILYLGDVAICYPVAQRLANKEQILVDEEIDRLIEHGLLNLLGINSVNLKHKNGFLSQIPSSKNR